MDNQSNIYLSRSNLRHNLAVVHGLVRPTDTVCACVKANAYGHGLELIAGELAAMGVDWLAVHTLNEASRLRQHGYHANLLILGPLTDPRHWQAAASLKARFFIYSLEQLRRYVDFTDRRATQPIHLKINTGLNRLGVAVDELDAALTLIEQAHLKLEGLATHFATADTEPADPLYTQQLTVWSAVVEQVSHRCPLQYVHAANSSTVLKGLAPTVGTLHRPGMALYGYSPVRSLRQRLRPVLTWQAPVVHVANVSKGETVSYGATWAAPRDSHLAVLSVGYYDGLDRGFSNQGQVLVHDQLCPIVGRVCMDMTMIDVTDLPRLVTVGEPATLITSDRLTAYDLAEQIDTIPYEVLTRLNPLSINRQLVA